MTVKKKPSGRSSLQARVEVADKVQTAAERRSAEAELNSLVGEFAPVHLRLIRAMRKSLQKRLPSAHEIVYEYRNQGAVVISYSPSEHGYEGVLAIRATADGVKLYFTRGKELADPEKLLQGASQTRFIDVDSASTLARPAVANLIEDAIAGNRVPFAADGKGSVVIRSTSEKKQRK